jgi:hypothetical protein
MAKTIKGRWRVHSKKPVRYLTSYESNWDEAYFGLDAFDIYTNDDHAWELSLMQNNHEGPRSIQEFMIFRPSHKWFFFDKSENWSSTRIEKMPTLGDFFYPDRFHTFVSSCYDWAQIDQDVEWYQSLTENKEYKCK